MSANIEKLRSVGVSLVVFTAVCLSLCISSCTGFEGYTGPVRGQIHGVVTSQNGGPVAGCLVSDGMLATTTDSQGRFKLSDVEPSQNIRLSFHASGFLRTFAFASVEGWETSALSVVMVPFGRPHSFMAEKGITLMERHPEGSYYLSIPPNGVVDAEGNLVSGEIEVHISPISLKGSPGDLTGIVYQEGQPHVVPLVSYKMTDITLTRPGDQDLYDESSEWGKKLNLAPGVSAIVELPLPQEMPLIQRPPIGKQILWWWWDPEVGHWVQDAIGSVKKSVDGSGRLSWRAEWTHFSRHGVLLPEKDKLGLAPAIAQELSPREREMLVANVDDPPPPQLTCVEAFVLDKQDNPIQGAEVWVEGVTRNMRTRFQSDSEGMYRVGPVEVGSTIEIVAQVMVGEELVDGRATYTVPGPGSADGFAMDLDSAVCNPGPDIIIPVCSAGGDVVAVSWQVGGNQTETFKLEGDNSFVEGAVGQFYEPYGEVEFCEPKLDRIEEDNCLSLSGAAMIGLDMKPPKSMDAGPWVNLAGAGSLANLQRETQPGDYSLGGMTFEQQDIFYRYDNSDESLAMNSGSYNVTAAGAQPGVPPFSEDNALVMPERLELTGEVEPVVRPGQALDLTWKAGTDDLNKVLILIIPEDAKNGIACRVIDDGAFSVPTETLKQLPQGMNESLLMVMRTRKNTFQLPQGTMARTRGMSGVLIANKIEGEAVCGDGNLDPGEVCDGDCPESCDDGDGCTIDKLNGDSAQCDAVCDHTKIDTCVDDDGCCPAACNYTQDNDCFSDCGNGILEGGETCDGDCPESCDDGKACTIDQLSGSAEFCSAMCSNIFITICQDDDGCCPAGCSGDADNDCNGSCGNNVQEPGELCDGDCPSSCDDNNSCTNDMLIGSADSCDAVCSNRLVTICLSGDGCCPAGCSLADDQDCRPSCGNGAMEVGETCDGNCPSKCDDGDSCTEDLLLGSAAGCDAKCSYRPIDICLDGDGCCPTRCIEAGDSDCVTDQVDQPDETSCDSFHNDPLLAPQMCDGPNGQTTTEKAPNGLYASSWFGCYAQADGTVAFDPADNCQFACGSMDLCSPDLSGPECQAKLKWFAAGADRYGCGARIKVSNCDSGKAVVLAVLDRGPNCATVELQVDAPVMDMSKPAMEHLFNGATYGAWDLTRVLVEEVPRATPLGPTQF